MTTDVLLVGYNGGDFDEYVASMRASGVRQAAYRDVALAALALDGHEVTAMDVLNSHGGRDGTALSNADFLWPVITYLGSYLEQAGFAWDYVNLFREQNDQLRAKLAAGDVRCVAITTTVYVSPQPILEVIALVRQMSPDTKIVVGGPYLSDKPKVLPPGELPALLSMLGADVYVFSSEGEATLVHLLGVLCRGEGELAEVPNIAYLDGGAWKLTHTVVESNPLEDHPVNYSLFRTADIGEFLSIRTAKSCPFNCSFCGFPGRAGKYTYNDVALVEAELDQIAALGSVSTITVIDDTFNVPKPRFKELLRMMIDNKYGFRWNSYLRSDHVDDEALDLMAESGCEGVFLGVESGSATQLANMNKTSRPEHYRHAIKRCRELGITTYASLIIGFPGETEATLHETLDFLEDARPDFYRAQCWYADPYTPVFKDLDQHRIVGQAFRWSHRTMDSQEASAWVDYFFNTVTASVWLPQNGFELWSVFYLQRHGMSRDRIKSYLRAWDDAVRFRILHGDQAPLDEGLRHRLLDEAAAHARPAAPVTLTRYSPENVRPALHHWIDVLTDGATAACGMTWAEFGRPASTWRLAATSPDGTATTLTGRTPAEVATAVAHAVRGLRGAPDVALLAGDLETIGGRYPVYARADGPTADRPDLAYTAESATTYLLERHRRLVLPDTAVLTGTETGLLDRLAEVNGTALGARVDVALVGLPDGRWLLAHRGVLDADDERDLLDSAGDPGGTTPVLAAATPTFDL